MKTIKEKIDKAARSYAYNNGYRDDNRDRYEAFKAGVEWAVSQQWVSVDDALPETDGDVLIYATYRGANSGQQKVFIEQYFYMKKYDQNGFGLKEAMNRHINLKVLAWMPIPPLPEARKEEEE